MPPKGWKKYPDGFKPVNSAGTPVKEKQKFKLDVCFIRTNNRLWLANVD